MSDEKLSVFHEDALARLGLRQVYVDPRIKAQLALLRGAWRWLHTQLERRTGMTDD